MAIPVRLEKPTAFFTNTLESCNKVAEYRVVTSSPVFWEWDAVLFLVRHGHGNINVNGDIWHLSKGDMCFLSPSQVFYFESDASEGLMLDVLVSPIALISMFDTQPTVTSRRVKRNSSLPCIHTLGELGEQIIRMFDRLKSQNHISLYLTTCIIQRITYTYFRMMTLPDTQAVHDESGNQLPQRLLEYISLNCSKHLSPTTTAKKFGINEHQLNTELYSVCGCTFARAVRHMRIVMARILLLRDLSLSDISVNCGFTSQSAFIRTFSAELGLAPNEYRKLMRTKLLGNSEKYLNAELAEVCRYIAENFTSQINAQSCAKTLYMSEELVEKIVEDQYGLRFSSTVAFYRLKYAAALLSVTDLNVSDIALSVGFNSDHTFTRQFKRKYGVTPGEYRSLKKGGDSFVR